MRVSDIEIKRDKVKAELDINTQELVREIANEVIKVIKPMLDKGKAEDDTLFTVESLAKYLGTSKQWVYERVHLKEIPYIKMGKFPRFKKADIDNWLDTFKVPAIITHERHLKAIKMGR